MTPRKRRFGFVTKASLYLFFMGGIFCAVLYPLVMKQYDKQVTAYAASLPDYSHVVPPVPYAAGHPVRIEVPSVGIDLPVVDGVYDSATRTWTLNSDKVQFAVETKKPNNREGNTFIYGHATNWVFGPLLRLQPDALAHITTDNGFVITYKLTGHEVVDPTNVGALQYTGPSRLMLQTCTGPTLSEFRQLFYFSYESHTRLSRAS